MDLSFVGKTSEFTVIYLDDLTVFSDSDESHLKHLSKVFDRCMKFGISFNPKKYLFVVKEGKLLAKIISKGVIIDPKRVSAIHTLSLPRNKKEIQTFLGKINFLRRFIPNYAKIVKDIKNMLKKNNEVKWTVPARYDFDHIKNAISEAPTLASPNYYSPFSIFSFSSETTLAAVILQNTKNGDNHPIAFFSKVMRDAKLRYDIIEKQAYALIQYLKAFRTDVLHSHIIAYVPNHVVKTVLTQPDTNGRRGRWIAKILEFDLEIKTTKLVLELWGLTQVQR